MPTATAVDNGDVVEAAYGKCKRTACENKNACCRHRMTGDLYCPQCARLINENNPLWHGARLVAFPVLRDPVVYLINPHLIRRDLWQIVRHVLGPCAKVFLAESESDHRLSGTTPDVVITDNPQPTDDLWIRLRKPTLILVRMWGTFRRIHETRQDVQFVGIGSGFADLKNALAEELFRNVTEGL